MVSVEKVDFSYAKEKVLEQLSWSLEASAIHGLAGSNGSGKTTLLNIINGNLKPDSGTVQINKNSASPMSLS